MLNCPGRNLNPSPIPPRSSVQREGVVVLPDDLPDHDRLRGHGIRGHLLHGLCLACHRATPPVDVVEVDELQTRRIETAFHHLRKTFQHFVAEVRVLLALVPEAFAVERDGARLEHRDRR